MSATEIFSNIYATGAWGKGSGYGSAPDFCAPIYEFLMSYIHQNHIESLVDLGCGDLRWIPDLVVNSAMRYVGIDCVSELIETHRVRYRAPQFQFVCEELAPESCEGLPEADLYLIKDVMQHWPSMIVDSFLDSFFKAKPNAILLTANCNYQSCSYRNLSMGGFVPLSEDHPPLNKYGPQKLLEWNSKSLYRLHFLNGS